MEEPKSPLRLAALPVVAGLTVLIVAGISMLDIGENNKKEQKSPEETLLVLRRHKRQGVVPRAERVGALSEREALERLEVRGPRRAAVDRLWPGPKHRERLLALLVAKETSEDIRLHLLGLFREAAPSSAVQAARAILGKQDLSQGPLLLAAYEVVARYGKVDDLVLLSRRPDELQQTRVTREQYRALLNRRLRPRG